MNNLKILMKIDKAEILERKIREDTSNEYLYYVHYEGCKCFFLFFVSLLPPNNLYKQP